MLLVAPAPMLLAQTFVSALIYMPFYGDMFRSESPRSEAKEPTFLLRLHSRTCNAGQEANLTSPLVSHRRALGQQNRQRVLPLDSERGEGRSTALQDLLKLAPALPTAMRASMPEAEPRLPSSRQPLLALLSSGYGSNLRGLANAAAHMQAHMIRRGTSLCATYSSAHDVP